MVHRKDLWTHDTCLVSTNELLIKYNLKNLRFVNQFIQRKVRKQSMRRKKYIKTYKIYNILIKVNVTECSENCCIRFFV